MREAGSVGGEMQRRRVGEEGEAREGGGGEWERKERRVGMGGKWEESGGYTTNFILSTLNISSSDKEQGKCCEKYVFPTRQKKSSPPGCVLLWLGPQVCSLSSSGE